METEGFGYLPGRSSLSKEKINKIIDILQLDKKAIKQSKIYFWNNNFGGKGWK